ncbi:cell division protein FtsQ/DivIB [Penaeicola halotolerans]|uniref:cell division protein FtsQ/DivIB n=1 Tax=Penaeicola halotolerans TaxID=2793196 RepID=UPI001CF87107|nr:cell division protein [Penaeicola halotolerans]
MSKQNKIKKTILLVAISLLMIASIALVEKKNSQKTVQSISIYVEGISGVSFVEEADILNMITNPEDGIVQAGDPISGLNMRAIESKAAGHPFVKRAEAFVDLKGNLRVVIDQYKPLARIVRVNAADAYISEEGLILPTSKKFTARVTLIEGAFGEQLIKAQDLTEAHQSLMDLLDFIERDKFWKAQVASLDIDSKGQITIYQQVGKQLIEFGKPEQIEEKFEKLKIFYDEILPAKGWNYYSRVNLKYKDQIVCE